MNEPLPHRRRPRYSGKNPRRYEDKYKELASEKYPEILEKVIASGKTPAGSHLPILVEEIVEVLNPKPGEKMIDATLGYGGHACELLKRLSPGGHLIGLDVDPLEIPRTAARLVAKGFGAEVFSPVRCNFAGLPKVLGEAGWSGTDGVLADLGVSSMQIDTPDRGFSVKHSGPLDMRMNPSKGLPASHLLAQLDPVSLSKLLSENADEPHAEMLASKLAGKTFSLTVELATAVREILRKLSDEAQALSIRRVFQALRIEVNQEFAALDRLLIQLPDCLNPGGRVAILSFHSGEDRRVKKAFQLGLREGFYSNIADNVVRPTPQELRRNPRASSAKLRWAIKTLG